MKPYSEDLRLKIINIVQFCEWCLHSLPCLASSPTAFGWSSLSDDQSLSEATGRSWPIAPIPAKSRKLPFDRNWEPGANDR